MSRIYDTDYLIQQIAREIFDTLSPHQRWRVKLQSASFSTPVGGLGLGTNNPFNRPVDLLRRVSNRASDDLVIFVYNIHELASDTAEIEATLREVAKNVSENVAIVTAGEQQFTTGTNIELEPFPEEVFIQSLENHFESVSTDQAQSIYNTVEGMPLYLGLLLETHSPDDDVSLNRIADEATTLIENYVNSLSTPEQEFLRQVSVLLELDEHICAHLTDRSAVETADLLRTLETKLAIQQVGRREGVVRYKIRDDIRNYLYVHAEDAQQSHQRMLEYYVEHLFEDQESELLGQALYPGWLCSYHLKGSVGGDTTPTAVKTVIDSLKLSMEERLTLCLTFLPMFCFQEKGTEKVLFDVLDEVRHEAEQRYPSEFNLSQLIGIDGYRLGYRILFAKETDDEEKNNRLHREAAQISESALNYISNHVSEEDDLGLWVVFLHLAAAYAHKSCEQSQHVMAHVEPVLEMVEQFGIPASVAKSVYARTERFYTQLELESLVQEVITSEMSDTFEAISRRQSPKEYLFDVQGNVNSVFEGAGAHLYAELQKHPVLLTQYLDDIVSIIAPDDVEAELPDRPEEVRAFSFTLRLQFIQFVYTVTMALGLYHQQYSRRFSTLAQHAEVRTDN